MSKDWSNINTSQLSLDFINHIENSYYRSYLEGSIKYERIHNNYFNFSILISFIISILAVIQSRIEIDFSFFLILLPLLSSFILMVSSQKGWKEKQEMREVARIKCKHLINEARLRWSLCKNNEEWANLYRWLNEEVEKIQLEQARRYFSVHNQIKQ